VALDVPTIDAAQKAVDRLDNVSFFKIGLELFLTGRVPDLLQSLRHKKVFVDLKLPGDIANTIAAAIRVCVREGVTFLTLSGSMPPATIRAARAARDREGSDIPKLLTVPFVSSLDATDLREIAAESNLETYILRCAHRAVEAGCEGIIASGDAIGACRQAFPPETIIVSPGIRPIGASVNDHKRSTTPSQAIAVGADYLVVGRPIMQASDPRAAAQAVIDEIDEALRARR
jgi:orotidine-5'-phosphate decarboxylase